MSERAESTGVSYYCARYYDPAAGRFVNEDPLEGAGGDPDFYRYVFNRPTNLVDPYGLSPLAPAIPWWPWKPISVPIPWGDAFGAAGRAVAGGIAAIYELTLGAKPFALDDARAFPKPQPCEEKRRACGDQWAKDVEFCAAAYPDDPAMQQACYEIADLNLERCLNGQTRVNPRPTPRKKP
jgi:RHS repeat-associated protein